MANGSDAYQQYLEPKEETEEDRVAEHYNLSLRSWRDIFDRDYLKKFLTYSQKVQIIIVVLVILDCIIVLTELLIDLGVIIKNECEHERDCPKLETNSTINATQGYFFCFRQVELTKCDFYDGKKRCITEETMPSVNPAKVLHILGLVVLGLFLVEIILKLYALGLEFFKHKLELFDALVVIVSFSLDLAVSGNEDAWEGAELLILLRLWRVARIANGAIISVKKKAEKKAEHLQAKVDRLMEEKKQLLERLREAKVEGFLENDPTGPLVDRSLHVPTSTAADQGDPHHPGNADNTNL